MAPTIFDTAQRELLLERLSRLQLHSERRWGKMNAAQMVCHLNDAVDVATGAAPAKVRKSLMANPLMRWLIIYAIPWPKGRAQTAPEMLVTQPAEFAADVAGLKQKLNAAAARGASGNWAPHPAFGKMSGKDYGALIYKHCNHHLTQFGV